MQAAFLHVLRRPGVCRQPRGWDRDEYGVGIVDAEAMLREPLPDPFALAGRRAMAAGAPDETIERIAAQTTRSADDVADAIDALFGAGSSQDEGFLRRFEGELVYLALTDDLFRARLTERGIARAAAAPPKVAAASPQLRARLG